MKATRGRSWNWKQDPRWPRRWPGAAPPSRGFRLSSVSSSAANTSTSWLKRFETPKNKILFSAFEDKSLNFFLPKDWRSDELETSLILNLLCSEQQCVEREIKTIKFTKKIHLQ
jgi:hypothetical protein